MSPGWTLKAFEHVEAPAGVPPSASRQCWKAEYLNKGSAEVWICGYTVEGGAFDAMQRAPAEANAVKFQEGRYLVIARWNGVTKTDITTLVRAIQKSILRNGRVYLVAPRQNAALHVADLRETGLPQKIHRFSAAHPALAMHHDLIGGVQFVQPFRQFA